MNRYETGFRSWVVLGSLCLGSIPFLTASAVLAAVHGESAKSGVPASLDELSDLSGFGVDERYGAATLSIPIDLPPGPNDLSPSLALSYSSRRGNGPLGVGWSLQLPRIVCSARFGVPDLARCPHFELNSQALVGPDSSGAYHTFEEDFSRIERVGEPATWRVTSTRGRTMVFGATAASRVESAGGIAEWHLSTISDVFGNTIHFEHERGANGDTGHLQPSKIHYANGTRQVSFVYESRPDALSGYRGGVRRVRSRRLREIRVEVNGLLHQRLILRYENARDTGVSRLVSIQRFGSDCAGIERPVDDGSCSALPAAEFEYADTGELRDVERWSSQGVPAPSSPWFSPVRLTPDHVLLRGDDPQFADVDGDGLVDLVTDQPGRQDAPPLAHPSAIGGWEPDPALGPQVWINDGSGGWRSPEWDGAGVSGQDRPLNDSARWTDALRALRFDLPTHRIKTTQSGFDPETRIDADGNPRPQSLDVLFGTCLASGEDAPGVEWIADGGSVQISGTGRQTPRPAFESTTNRSYPHEVDEPLAYADHAAYQAGGAWAPRPPAPHQLRADSWEEVATSEFRPWPDFRWVDLDADGRADLVMSVRLSGFHLTLDDCVSARMRARGEEVWVEGATVSVVFLNTGDPDRSGGWIRDSGRTVSDGNHADGLPPFGVVAFESPDLAFREIGRGDGFPYDDTIVRSPCDDAGLAGQRSYWEPQASVSDDFCVTTYDLSPVFRDFNGDGFVDLMVTETADPDALFHRPVDAMIPSGDGAFGNFRSSTTTSAVYLQNPDARGGEPRWVRAPAYDPPYEHALVVQLPGDSPGQVGVIAYRGSTGNPQTYHVDKGVRFVDLNRDGLADMLFSAAGASLGEFADRGGVLLNRGSADPLGPRHSAWCSSAPVPGVDLCATEAGPYAAPHAFAWFDVARHRHAGSWNQRFLTPASIGFEIVDLNGDGWPDLLTQDDDTSEGRRSRAWIHHPGRASSVWVEDDRFRPPQTKPFQDFIDDALGPGVPVVRSGYGFLDANGDGVLDLVPSEPLHPEKPAWISTLAAAASDVMTSYRDGRGRRVELMYRAPLSQRDPALERAAEAQARAALEDDSPENDALAEPLESEPAARLHWTKDLVLSSMRVFTPQFESPAETRLRYAHPRRCTRHGKDLGFRLVQTIRPDGSSVDTYFYQAHGRAGRLAARLIRDEQGRPRRVEGEEWKRPDPLSVRGGWSRSDPSAARFGIAHIGRLQRVWSRNEYGDFVGEVPGFESATEFRYDDTHGYGFVEETRHRIPGRSSRVVATPARIDLLRHLVDRAARIEVYGDEVGDEGLISAVQLEYVAADGRASFDRPGIERRIVADRRTGEGARVMTTGFVFAPNGNRIERRDYASEDGSLSNAYRSTTYCYDGDATCPVGQRSHGLLAGVRDTLGHWTRTDPDPIFAQPARTTSDYFDVPSTRVDYDPLGRVVARRVELPGASAPQTLSETLHVDRPEAGLFFEGTPIGFVVTRQFADASDGPLPGSVFESIRVSTGEGTLLAVEMTRVGSGTDPLWTVTARSSAHDPAHGTKRTSLPFVCPGSPFASPPDYEAILAACGAVPDTAKEMETVQVDVLGRVVRIENSLGSEMRSYGASTYRVGERGPWVPHDLVFEKRANGGLRQVILAAGRAVAIRECGGVPQPALETLDGVECAEPEVSRMLYEPTGELRERVDPTVPVAGGSGPHAFGAERSQSLRYRYDTLGRVVALFDPDAGASTRRYDILGNAVETTDARGIRVKTEHDLLGRPTRVTVDGEEGASEFGYGGALPFTRVTRVYDRRSVRWFGYDGLGRPTSLASMIDGRFMRVRRHYDLLGRVLRIEYPKVFQGLENTILYEYEGGFLARVCDLDFGSGDCRSDRAKAIVEGVDRDDLGRVVRLQLPGGDRAIDYDGLSARVSGDRFDSATLDGANDFEMRFEPRDGSADGAIYDPLGNPIRRTMKIGDAIFESGWEFDARNRIAAWRWREGAAPFERLDYAYDARGNRIGRGSGIQIFGSPERAHSVETRVEEGATWHYAYDAAGHLERRTRVGGGSTYYRFDGRGRMICVERTRGACDLLSVDYDGLGERVRESHAGVDHHLGRDFRLHTRADGARSVWIGITVLGQRIAYRHASGGRNAWVGLFPGRRFPPWLLETLALVAIPLVVALLVPLLAGAAPGRSLGTALVAIAVALFPLRVWAAGSGGFSVGFQGLTLHRWVISDSVGSSLAEFDASGRLLRYVVSSPFGRVSAASGADPFGDRREYAGHTRHPGTGLVFMNARWMDPMTGTFVSVDPLVRAPDTAQAFNGYAYAENNPVSAVDPTGRSIEWRIAWSDPDTGETRAASHWQQAAGVADVVGDHAGFNISIDGRDAGFASFVRGLPSVSATGRILSGRGGGDVGSRRASRTFVGDASTPQTSFGRGRASSEGSRDGAAPADNPLHSAGHGLLFSMRQLPRLLARLEDGKAIATLPGRYSGPIPRALFVVLGAAHSAYYMKMLMDNVVHQNALRPRFDLPLLDLDDAFTLGGYAGSDLSTLYTEMDRVRAWSSIPAEAYR